MITTLEINGFRCFDHLKINQIAPITLIGGRNNSGKSAILEAIFLLIGHRNPNTYVALAMGRNGNGKLTATPQKLWSPLFYELDKNESFSIAIQRNTGINATLSMRKVPDDNASLDINSDVITGLLKQGYNPNHLNSYFYSLQYTYTINASKSEGIFSIENGKIHYISKSETLTEKVPFTKVLYFKNVYTPDNATIAEWVSRLVLEQRKQLLIDILQAFDSRISDVITVVEDGVPATYVVLKDARHMPISYMGDGINKILQLLLCILTSPQGIVLIDEVENGFHYSLYPQILNTLYNAALQVQCQLFITTHNIDILNDSVAVMKEEGKLQFLCYQRMNFSDGKRQAYSFSGTELETALAAEMEVR